MPRHCPEIEILRFLRVEISISKPAIAVLETESGLSGPGPVGSSTLPSVRVFYLCITYGFLDSGYVKITAERDVNSVNP